MNILKNYSLYYYIVLYPFLFNYRETFSNTTEKANLFRYILSLMNYTKVIFIIMKKGKAKSYKRKHPNRTEAGDYSLTIG